MEKTERRYQFGNSSVRVRLGDIVDAQTAVIVSSDDTQITMGGGVSRAILQRGGQSIQKDAKKATNGLRPGDVVVTSAGTFTAKHIFHAITRVLGSAGDENEAHQIRVIEQCTNVCLERLDGLGLDSIAFPALGTGTARFGVDRVAATMARVFREALHARQGEALEVELYIHPKDVANDISFWDFVQQLDRQAEITDSVVADHAVAMIHGIMTDASWYDRVDQLLRDRDHQLLPTSTGYGPFDVVRFLIPTEFAKRAVIAKVAKNICMLCEDDSFKSVSVIAHSFGTYILAAILRDHPEIKLHRVILCGSVLPIDYDWQAHAEQIDRIDNDRHRTRIVLNDCGWKDIWPVMAKCMTWGYGTSGRFGFQSPATKDRFHRFAHSDFFTDTFIEQYWLPFLANGEVREGDKERPPISVLMNIASAVKLPIIVALAFVGWYILSR